VRNSRHRARCRRRDWPQRGDDAVDLGPGAVEANVDLGDLLIEQILQPHDAGVFGLDRFEVGLGAVETGGGVEDGTEIDKVLDLAGLVAMAGLLDRFFSLRAIQRLARTARGRARRDSPVEPVNGTAAAASPRLGR
jgi:hypothetical protein